ncbi:MAG: hypothetical protein A4E72_01748 [Syntrophus sp. PtaU1.Bin208]|nr:MAG: hypothetical protein A4E72_01748 [Syntrophus sp. PtaU1.Bin208]
MLQDCGMADPGIEPDIENIRFFPEFLALTFRADRPGRQKIRSLPFKPDIGAEFPDETHQMIHDLRSHQMGATGFAVKHGNRNAPQALP